MITTRASDGANNMTCSLSRTMMPPSFNLHLQCQEAILPSWRKLFPHMAELLPEVNHEERRRYRKSTFLFLRKFVPQHGMEHLACLPPSQATSPPFPAWPSLMGSTTPLNVRIIIKKTLKTQLYSSVHGNRLRCPLLPTWPISLLFGFLRRSYFTTNISDKYI